MDGGSGAIETFPIDSGGLDVQSGGSFPLDASTFKFSDLGNPDFQPTSTVDMLQPLASQVNPAGQGQGFSLGVDGVTGPLREPVFDMSGGEVKFLGFRGPDGTVQDLQGNTLTGPGGSWSPPNIPGLGGSGSGGSGLNLGGFLPKDLPELLGLGKALGGVLAPTGSAGGGGGAPGSSSTTNLNAGRTALGIPISTLQQLQQLVVRAGQTRPGPLSAFQAP